MKITWCKGIEGIVNIARGQGWIFYCNRQGRHYYYVYTGIESELLCVAVEVKEPLKARYVSIDEDGRLIPSDKPILPACAMITEVVKDEAFESLVG